MLQISRKFYEKPVCQSDKVYDVKKKIHIVKGSANSQHQFTNKTFPFLQENHIRKWLLNIKISERGPRRVKQKGASRFFRESRTGEQRHTRIDSNLYTIRSGHEGG